MARDVAAHERRAEFLGIERRHLLVEGADAHALVIVQHRIVDRAGNVILGEFRFGARVDYLVKFGELCYGNQLVVTRIRAQSFFQKSPMNDPLDLQKIRLTAFSHGGG